MARKRPKTIETAEALKRRDVAALLGVGVRTIETTLMKDPEFPRPIRLGRCVRFLRSEILAYIHEHAPRSGSPGERRNAS